MNDRPVTLIVRLWRRPDGFIAEVRELRGDRRTLVHGQADLLRHLASFLDPTHPTTNEDDPG